MTARLLGTDGLLDRFFGLREELVKRQGPASQLKAQFSRLASLSGALAEQCYISSKEELRAAEREFVAMDAALARILDGRETVGMTSYHYVGYQGSWWRN